MTQTALTREQVLAMEPGRELDELVITRVLGLQIVNHEEVTYDWVDSPENYPYVSRGSLSKTNLMKWLEPDGDGFIIEPSTDLSAAWEVEEKIKELRLQAKYCESLKQVVVGTGEYVGMFDYIHATPAQRCKAALLAVLDL